MMKQMALLGALFAVACGDGASMRSVSDDAPSTPLAASPQPSRAPGGDLVGVPGTIGTSGAPGTSGHPTTTGVRKGPPYPIVLAHGFFGAETFAGKSFLTYFYEVRQALTADGETQIYTPAVDPFNDSSRRGAQLLRHIETILDQTGYAKVNIIAHSQAGLDARVVADARPELIASIITISTPHQGTPLSDLVGSASPLAEQVMDTLLRMFGGRIWDDLSESSLKNAFVQLGTKATAEFNERYPLPAGIPFYSVAGRTGLRRNARECQVDGQPEFIRQWNDSIDMVTPLLALTETLLSPNELFPVGNDGLVPVSSAKLGTFLGCFPADHLDEIGHIAGASPGPGNPWRHKSFYADLVSFIRGQGL